MTLALARNPAATGIAHRISVQLLLESMLQPAKALPLISHSVGRFVLGWLAVLAWRAPRAALGIS
jgi:hypothetical protein